MSSISRRPQSTIGNNNSGVYRLKVPQPPSSAATRQTSYAELIEPMDSTNGMYISPEHEPLVKE